MYVWNWKCMYSIDISKNIFSLIIKPEDSNWYLEKLKHVVAKQGLEIITKTYSYKLVCYYNKDDGKITDIKLVIADGYKRAYVKVINTDTTKYIEAPELELDYDDFVYVSNKINSSFDLTEKSKYNSISKILSYILDTVNNKASKMGSSMHRDTTYINTKYLIEGEIKRILPLHNVSVKPNLDGAKKHIYGKNWILKIEKNSKEGYSSCLTVPISISLSMVDNSSYKDYILKTVKFAPIEFDELSLNEFELKSYKIEEKAKIEAIEINKSKKLQKKKDIISKIESTRNKISIYNDTDIIYKLIDKISSSSLDINNNNDKQLISNYDTIVAYIDKYIGLSKELVKIEKDIESGAYYRV